MKDFGRMGRGRGGERRGFLIGEIRESGGGVVVVVVVVEIAREISWAMLKWISSRDGEGLREEKGGRSVCTVGRSEGSVKV